ncbi:MAG: AAA-like domain-containing protein [Polyangiaceae bacterium]|nr:AAA-like domain-containing protein [Polyangiaceae bacterium]
MRKFSSYGPVDARFHFSVSRRELVAECAAQLVNNSGDRGHFFTIWAPRQAGKTWLMKRAMEEIRSQHGDRFVVGSLLVQGALDEQDTDEVFFRAVPRLFRDGFGVEPEAPQHWEGWMRLFSKQGGIFDRPLILLIDEFDTLPAAVIDRLVSTFRAMYLSPQSYVLHGLALVGVRAVLGVESPRGPPFNVQRALRVPNLTRDEVVDLFDQYQTESAQKVESAVVEQVFNVTRGQPGLVSWFGELVTEKYNADPTHPITTAAFNLVYGRACQVEWNNTILNLIKKARGPYLSHVVSLFTNPNVPFSLDKDWCNYLHMNGVIDEGPPSDNPSSSSVVCRFSSPYVQRRLFAALTDDMFGDKAPLLAIEPGDLLADVFLVGGLALPPLVERYRGYLKRLKAAGIDPWVGQPRRADLHLTEAVGHFHLYAWLRDAVGRRCVISPEFPTGNGKVDLVLHTEEGHLGLIEVKSFVDMYELQKGQAQAAAYAKKLGVHTVTMVVFVPMEDERVPASIIKGVVVDGVTVQVVAIGWV